MTALLRGSRANGYRTSAPLECPCCHKAFDIAGTAAEDRQGPHLMLYPVAAKDGEYDAATLQHVMHGPPSEHTGVALPQPPKGARLVDDPVPDFGSDGT